MTFFILKLCKKLFLLIVKIIIFPNLGLDFQSEIAIKPLLDIYYKKHFTLGLFKSSLDNLTIFGFVSAYFSMYFGVYFIQNAYSTNPRVVNKLIQLGFEDWYCSSIALLGFFLFAAGVAIQLLTLQRMDKLDSDSDSESDPLI